MSFTPKLFIGIGATQAFFTLRETYVHETYVRGEGPMGGAVVNGVYQGHVHREVRSLHHFNLSQDLDEAIEKARECADRMGLPLSADRETLACEMRDIKRANAEELERREREAAERQALWEAERRAEELAHQEKLEQALFPFGPYVGKPFSEAPRGYLTWLARTSFEEGSRMAALGAAVARLVPELLLPIPDPQRHLGELKQRLTLDVLVIRSAYFDRPMYGFYDRLERCYVTTMIDKATNACLVVKSVSFSAEEGEEFTLKGTVKEHSEYKGQAQTRLERVAVVAQK